MNDEHGGAREGARRTGWCRPASQASAGSLHGACSRSRFRRCSRYAAIATKMTRVIVVPSAAVAALNSRCSSLGTATRMLTVSVAIIPPFVILNSIPHVRAGVNYLRANCSPGMKTLRFGVLTTLPEVWYNLLN